MGESKEWSTNRSFSSLLTKLYQGKTLSQKYLQGETVALQARWTKESCKQLVIQQVVLNNWLSLDKTLFVLAVLCLCHYSAATDTMIQCPDRCQCLSTKLGTPASLTINCSGLGFYHINIDDSPQSNKTKDSTDLPNSTNQAEFNRTLLIPVYSFPFEGTKLSSKKIIKNNVKSLDLSNNNLQSLNKETFQHYLSLDYLNISYNKINEIDMSTFSQLIHLRILDLSHNNIQELKWDSTYALVKLAQLFLNNNNIHIEANFTFVFPPLPQLTTLDISHNPLTELRPEIFHNLHSLKMLEITNCSIHFIGPHVFQNLKQLEKLNLDSNNISSIADFAFQDMSLKWLSISSALFLSNLSLLTFSGLSSLEHLNLSHNPNIHWIQPDLFSPLQALKVVDLSYNSIQYLSKLTFHNSKSLDQVYLNQNPLQCSCINAWLAEETFTKTKLVNVSATKCISDDGTRVPITAAEFKCQEIIVHNMTSKVYVLLGSKMLLHCNYDLDDAAIIKWTTPSGEVFYHHQFYSNASLHMLTPSDVKPDSPFHTEHHWHDSSAYHSELLTQPNRIMILSDGSLYIDYVTRSDPGPYKCEVSNQLFNKSASIKIYLTYKLSGEVKIFSIIFGLLCALGFFTLNVIYVIVSWIARRLVNKRRREIIRQMLESLNTYKTTQISRIHENYTHQLARVRNQYHIQRDKLHRNYTSQVTRMKRGCSNQVEKVRDNYNSKLHQLRDYSSNQILQIRERANNQILRIRDYGSYQLDKLRETYKLQQQHILKLLDTMNLDNCRNVVETECMRTESMMYDIDLLGEEDRTDSPTSQAESVYTTAASSPATSLEETSEVGLSSNMLISQQSRDYSTSSSENNIVIEMQTKIDLEPTITMSIADMWEFSPDHEEIHQYTIKIHSDAEPENKCLLELKSEDSKLNCNLGTYELQDNLPTSSTGTSRHENSESYWVTPDSSPVKHCPIHQMSDDLSDRSSASKGNIKDNRETIV